MTINALPEAVTGGRELTAQVTNKKGYADRWQFSTRTIDNLIKAGLPHCKIGERAVRIVVPEADQWMRERFGTQRRGAAK